MDATISPVHRTWPSRRPSTTRTAAGEPAVGEAVTFTVVLTNNGLASDGSEIVVDDPLPPDLAFVSDTPLAGTMYDPMTGVWTVGNLADAPPSP